MANDKSEGPGPDKENMKSLTSIKTYSALGTCSIAVVTGSIPDCTKCRNFQPNSALVTEGE